MKHLLLASLLETCRTFPQCRLLPLDALHCLLLHLLLLRMLIPEASPSFLLNVSITDKVQGLKAEVSLVRETERAETR